MNPPSPQRELQRGFTLLELMIVSAVIGILASLAVPSYQAYVYRAKASEVILVMDKIHTVLAGLQAQTGATLGTPVKLGDNALSPGDMTAPALSYCVDVQRRCPDGYKVVSGLNRNELFFKHFGVRLLVSSGFAHVDAPGQYKISISEASEMTRSDPALRKTARQIMLAVEQVMKPHTYLSKVGNDSVYLYFNMNVARP